MPFQSATDRIVSYSPPYYNEAPGPGPGVFCLSRIPTRTDPKPEALLDAARTRTYIIVCVLFVLWLYCLSKLWRITKCLKSQI